MYACALTLKLYVCLLAYIVKKKFFMLTLFFVEGGYSSLSISGFIFRWVLARHRKYSLAVKPCSVQYSMIFSFSCGVNRIVHEHVCGESFFFATMTPFHPVVYEFSA